MLNNEQNIETLKQHGYTYIRNLGSGSFSDVLLCQSTKYNQCFAIKRAIKHHISVDEYKYLISLHHPHIIKLYDTFEDDEAQYLVFDYCQNGTISERGKLTIENFIQLSKQILEAVAFCHSHNIAHRDLKPENIFLDQYNHIKLADFGMAKQFQFNGKSTEKCGSIMFCPPEMFVLQEIDPFKADIWALGITFFFMITGKYPFKSKSKEELIQLISKAEINFDNYNIPPKIRLLISKMTIKDQHNRLTAEKLLENPLFKKTRRDSLIRSQSNMKITFTGYHTHTNISINKSFTFDLDMNSQDEQSQSATQHTTIHSYKSFNPPQKNQRINGRILPVKTFE